MRVSQVYKEIAEKDLKSSEILFENELYNEAAYYIMQYMEKCVKEKLCRTIDVTNTYFSNKLREIGHSLDASVEFLIEILSQGNSVLKEQITKQLVEGVLRNIRFSGLYNEVRYPRFNYKYNQYTILNITKEDCEALKQISENLRKYLDDLDKLL